MSLVLQHHDKWSKPCNNLDCASLYAEIHKNIMPIEDLFPNKNDNYGLDRSCKNQFMVIISSKFLLSATDTFTKLNTEP